MLEVSFPVEVVSGVPVVTAPEEKQARVLDLADALRRSVEAARKGGKPAAKGASRPTRRQTRPARRTRKVS